MHPPYLKHNILMLIIYLLRTIILMLIISLLPRYMYARLSFKT
jgi:hypothetical protein